MAPIVEGRLNKGSSEKVDATGDFLSLTINDDLSGLLQFTAVARGAVEI